MLTAPLLIPELDVSDLDRSLAVYVDILGFTCHASRPEDRFAYLIRDGVHLMLEEARGPGRRFRTAPLDHPFGRGMNLQIEVADVNALYASVLLANVNVVIAVEERWYRQGDVDIGNRQFVMSDPDGYLLRFVGNLGKRAFAHRS